MARVKIELNTRNLRRKTDRFPGELRRAIETTVDYGAARAVGYMKTNAPWSDDTGAARSGLTATPIHEKTASEILLAYSVHYGIWLEIANSGRFAILIPTMRVQGELVMADIRNILGRMGRAT